MMNPKVMARMVRHQYQDLKATLPLANEKPSCGCGGCTCGADEVQPDLTKADKKEA